MRVTITDKTNLDYVDEGDCAEIAAYPHLVERIVAMAAPYGRKQRAEFFQALRDYADKHVPCQYDH